MTEAGAGLETTIDLATFWSLFGPAVLASLVTAALCGSLGFFVVTRRIGFVSAALGQVAGLGVAGGFFVGSLFGLDPHEPTPLWLDPVILALVLSGLTAMALAYVARLQRTPPESAVALVYLSATAAAVLLLANPRLALEKHEVEMLMFGNAVAVSNEHLVELIAVAGLVLISQVLLFKDLLFVSFDRDMAKALGLPVTSLELFLHLSIGVSVAVATRAIGALPVFGFLVLPAGAALLAFDSVAVTLVLSMLGAVLAAGLGFYLSFLESAPTGPLMVLCAAAYWPLAALIRAFNSRASRG